MRIGRRPPWILKKRNVMLPENSPSCGGRAGFSTSREISRTPNPLLIGFSRRLPATGGASFTGSRIPDLNLQMGDNAYTSGTDAEYQTGYFNMYANIFRKMPQWSTLGNHDANNGSTNPLANFPYFDMFAFPTAGECGGVGSGTEHYYSFD